MLYENRSRGKKKNIKLSDFRVSLPKECRAITNSSWEEAIPQSFIFCLNRDAFSECSLKGIFIKMAGDKGN